MSDLSPRTRALLDAARAAGGSTPGDRARVFAAVAARTGLAGAAATTATAVTAALTTASPAEASPGAASPAVAEATKGATAAAFSGAKLAVLVALVSGFGVVAALHSRTLPPPLAAAAMAGAARGSMGSQRANTPPDSPTASATATSAAVPPAPAPVLSVSPSDRAAEPALTHTVAPVAARSRPIPPPVRASTAAALGTLSPPDIAGSSSALGDELALVRGARAAMRAGDHPAALALLDQHAARFPAGMLREERDANRAIALCRLERRADAARAATDFFARYPYSPYADRVRLQCTVERP